LLLVGTLLGLFVTYWLPWILFFVGEDPAWLFGSTAASLMTVTFLFTVKFYNRSALWALTLPFAAAFYGYATFLSAVRYWLGRGAQWKGRSQAPSGS
jgi:TctA family transporter